MTAFPVRGDPEALTVRHAAVMGGCLVLCAVAPSYATAFGTALAGAAIGLGPRVLLATGAAITLGGTAVAVLDRGLTPAAGPARRRSA